MFTLYGALRTIKGFTNRRSNRISPANEDNDQHSRINFGKAQKLIMAGVLLDIALQALSISFSWPYAYGYCQYWWEYVTPALHLC